jgi:SAM-dependent methyltransferase
MTPSAWVVRWLSLLPTGGSVLDVAAGGGRHTRVLADRGHRVTAVDRETAALEDLEGRAGVEVVTADLEAAPWPFAERRFDAVVVTNYLHRPLLPTLVSSVAPGGVLLYETFACGHERHGRPSNPAWLLRSGELLETVRGELRVIAYEDVELPRPACVQRIVAVRGSAPA